MSEQPDKAKPGWERLIQAYDVMLQRAEHGLATAAAGSETALAHALFARYRSRRQPTFADQVLSAMRKQFGGHAER